MTRFNWPLVAALLLFVVAAPTRAHAQLGGGFFIQPNGQLVHFEVPNGPQHQTTQIKMTGLGNVNNLKTSFPAAGGGAAGTLTTAAVILVIAALEVCVILEDGDPDAYCTSSVIDELGGPSNAEKIIATIDGFKEWFDSWFE